MVLDRGVGDARRRTRERVEDVVRTSVLERWQEPGLKLADTPGRRGRFLSTRCTLFMFTYQRITCGAPIPSPQLHLTNPLTYLCIFNQLWPMGGWGGPMVFHKDEI